MTTQQRAEALPMPASDGIVAIASGKGGVGKTWFAVTLSHALGRRRHRTLLFDADMGLANVDVQIGLMPERDLAATLAARRPLAEAVTPVDGAFDVIAGRSGSGALGRLQPAQLDGIARDLVALAPDYDTVVIDLGAGVEDAVLRMAGAAGRCIVLISDEPTSLTDGYAFIKVARTRHPQMRFDVVVNMADGVKQGERTYAAIRRACETFLRFTPPLLGIVRADPKVKDSIRRQTPILTCHPGSSAAGDVEAIAARLGGEGTARHG